MNAQFFDVLYNFLRVSFLLFHLIIFYYILFWRSKIEPQINKEVIKYFFIILFLNFILNVIVLFKDLENQAYFYLVALNSFIIGAVLFYSYRKFLKFNWFYLLFPAFSALAIFLRKDEIFIFLSLLSIGFSYFHMYYKEKFTLQKPSRISPSIIKKGIVLPFVFFGFYILCLAFYLLTQSLFFNFLATFFVFLSLTFRVRSLYEERFKACFIYILAFVFVVSILIYLSMQYIENEKDMDVYRKKLTFERLSLEIKNKIDFYSDLIRFIASSDELKDKIKEGTEELNKYLSYLNQTLDTALVWFIDKRGDIKACSAEYREVMINKNVSFRRYFKESIQGSLSVFIARGVYTGRDDIRVSYPVHDRDNIVGVLVFQFYISEDFKKHINMENAFLMHSSGGVLIGSKELKNRLIYNISEEELKKVHEEKIFGNDYLLPSGFRQIDSFVFEDFKGQKWQIIKQEVIKDWFLASFIDLSLYDQYRAIAFTLLIIFAFVSHSLAIKSFERLRNIFLNLAEEFEEKRVAFDAIDTGIIYTDSSGKIKYMNKEAMRLLEASEETIGKNLSEVLILEEHENPEYKVLRGKEKKTPVIYTVSSISIRGIRFGNVFTIKDATEIIQRRQFAQRLERMDVITKISAGIVHDFSNYLMVLTGNLSLIKELGPLENKKKT